MPDQEDLLDKIDAYLQDRLSDAEKQAFEAEIQADPVLANTVEMQRATLAALDRMFVLRMKEKARQWRMKEEEPPPPPPSPRFPRWVIGLGLLLLLVGAFWAYKEYETREAQRIGAEEMGQDILRKQHQRDSLQNGSNAILDSLVLKAIRDSIEQARLDSLRNIIPVEPIYAALSRQELDNYVDSYSNNKRGNNEPIQETVIDQAGKAINEKNYREARRLLESVSSTDQAFYARALDKLAYVYARQGLVTKSVETYKKYMVVSKDSDAELLNWRLLYYCLADYPRYKTEVKGLLEPMLKNPDHDFHDKAINLRAVLMKKGVW